MTRRHVWVAGRVLLVIAVIVIGVVLFATRSQVSSLIATRHAQTLKQIANAQKGASGAVGIATGASRKAKAQQKLLTRVVDVLKVERIFEQGTPGQQGIAGTSVRGPVGPPGQNGVSGASVSGPAGIQGPAGSPGASIVGPTGAAGVDGQNGGQGPTGATGVGDAGPTGPQGDPGAPGANGVSPTVTQLPVGDPNCPLGGAAITDASGNTTYVCSGS